MNTYKTFSQEAPRVTPAMRLVGAVTNAACAAKTRPSDSGNHTLFAANATTNTYSANSLNQYTSILCASVSPCELSYDADGNLLSDGVFIYAYDLSTLFPVARRFLI